MILIWSLNVPFEKDVIHIRFTFVSQMWNECESHFFYILVFWVLNERRPYKKYKNVKNLSHLSNPFYPGLYENDILQMQEKSIIRVHFVRFWKFFFVWMSALKNKFLESVSSSVSIQSIKIFGYYKYKYGEIGYENF